MIEKVKNLLAPKLLAIFFYLLLSIWIKVCNVYYFRAI